MGDTVFAGCFVLEGEARARVTATGADTRLAEIARLTAGQMANAYVCRSSRSPAWKQPASTNPLLMVAVGVELLLLLMMLYAPPLAALLHHAGPTVVGGAVAVCAVPAVLVTDAFYKRLARQRK